MLDEWSLRSKWLKKRLYLLLRFGGCIRRASALHCTTEMEAVSTARAGIRAQQVIVEPNGVAVEDFTAMSRLGEFRQSIGIGEKPLVVFLGRVHPGKGVEYLLPALAITSSAGFAVAIVGPIDSEFAREMIRRAEALKGKCEVIFTGMLAGKDRIPPLADADVFVLPSEHENFGVAVVEALAAGCPVVVSNHVGLAKEIERQNVGTVTTLAPAGIARALDGWLARAGQDEEGRARRRAYALATFDWNNIAARWREHYQRLTA
jgi:glycosyltransferase involved in cell wall biosynthesis